MSSAFFAFCALAMNKILLIGGTAIHRGTLKAALEGEGFRVTSAITHKYTNTWLGHRIKPFDMLIYDTEEAERDASFFEEMRAAAPPTVILVLTSVFDSTDYGPLGVQRVLRRPYTIGDVINSVHELLTDASH